MERKDSKSAGCGPGGIVVCIILAVVCAATVAVHNNADGGAVTGSEGADGVTVDGTFDAGTSGTSGTTDEVSEKITDWEAETESVPPLKSEDEIFGEVCAMSAGDVIDTSPFSRELIDRLFFAAEIGDDITARIRGVSYRENDNIALDDLRYVRVLHRGFDGATHIGELIVNAAIADDIVVIMRELYENDYPIEKMVLVDEYGGDDEASMSDNNTSAFNYRVIANTTTLSNHALGMAIDINPRYNPYVTVNGGVSPENGAEYADRSRDFPAKIDHDDLCYRLFTEHGFDWGGDWSNTKDYQHFEKKG